MITIFLTFITKFDEIKNLNDYKNFCFNKKKIFLKKNPIPSHKSNPKKSQYHQNYRQFLVKQKNFFILIF
jgi:hypothetical protein